jgi:phage tail sheath gpL-like
MAITFNNIPTTIRTPNVYLEVDNSRALKGLLANPYKVLIVGQKVSEGAGVNDVLYAITKDGLANGYFGPGSILARMCNVFKLNNQNTELYAVSLSDPAGGVAASATIKFSVALSAVAIGGSLSGTEPIYMLVNGKPIYETLYSGWSVKDINSAIQSTINADSTLAVKASTTVASALNLIAVNVGSWGNLLSVRFNFYEGQSYPTTMNDSVPTILSFAGGVGCADVGDAWAVVDGQQFQIIISPYTDSANMIELKDELADRFKPDEDLWGHGITAYPGTQASCTTIGNSHNSPHVTMIGAYNSPTPPEEWAAALGAVAAAKLNDDPARPLQFLKLAGVIAPNATDRFSRAERDILLYDGIATWICDTEGNVMIERCITTYKTNVLGLADYSYLDIETLATLAEIRYQYKARMQTRFILPRYKLADDSFPVPPGAYIVTPKTIRQETIALFGMLQDKGLVENLEDFITNLIVERNAADRNRVDVLLPPDLVNQFRILAGVIQFIL